MFNRLRYIAFVAILVFTTGCGSSNYTYRPPQVIVDRHNDAYCIYTISESVDNMGYPQAARINCFNSALQAAQARDRIAKAIGVQ